MHSSVDYATPSPASTLGAVLLGAKETRTSIRSGTATMTSAGTIHSIALGGQSASQTITCLGCIVAASPCTVSRWPSAAHSRKPDGLSVASPSGAMRSTTLDGQGLVMQGAMHSSQVSSVAKSTPSTQSTQHHIVVLSVVISCLMLPVDTSYA